MKTHLFSSHTLSDAPYFIINAYQKQGRRGMKCGYVRLKGTYDESKVTCGLCLKEMKKDETD